MTIVKRDDRLYDGTYGIECPVCGYNYMHHKAVEVFTRGGEDNEEVQLTTVRETGFAVETIPSFESDNPSSRRSGLVIHFECESGHKSALAIAQHKGETFMRWRTNPNDKDFVL